jgi:hypothetical protein
MDINFEHVSIIDKKNSSFARAAIKIFKFFIVKIFMIHPVYRVAQKSIYRKKFEYPHSVLIKWAVFLSMIEESSKFLYIRKTLKNASLNYNF